MNDDTMKPLRNDAEPVYGYNGCDNLNDDADSVFNRRLWHTALLLAWNCNTLYVPGLERTAARLEDVLLDLQAVLPKPTEVTLEEIEHVVYHRTTKNCKCTAATKEKWKR